MEDIGYGNLILLKKNYIIKKKLSEINDNDILIYLDAGCHINVNGKKRFDEYIDIVNTGEKGLMSFQMSHHPEKNWTVKEIFEYFNVDIDSEIATSGQIAATMQVIKKVPHSIKLIDLWVDTLYKSPILFTDYYNKTNKPSSFFNENRHDQSIFSIIRKIHGSHVIEDDTWVENFGDDTSITVPFWATRIRC